MAMVYSFASLIEETLEAHKRELGKNKVEVQAKLQESILEMKVRNGPQSLA